MTGRGADGHIVLVDPVVRLSGRHPPRIHVWATVKNRNNEAKNAIFPVNSHVRSMHQLETLSSFELVRSFEPDAVKYRFLDTDKQSNRERYKKFQIDKNKKKNSFILRIIKDIFFRNCEFFFYIVTYINISNIIIVSLFAIRFTYMTYICTIRYIE